MNNFSDYKIKQLSTLSYDIDKWAIKTKSSADAIGGCIAIIDLLSYSNR